MSLKHVTQLAFLAEHGYMVILADRVQSLRLLCSMDFSLNKGVQVLYMIDVESIVPTPGRNTSHPTFGLQVIGGQDRGVQFFSVGRQHGRTLIILKRKRGVRKRAPIRRHYAYT